MTTTDDWRGVPPEAEMAVAAPDDEPVSAWSWLAAALYLGGAVFILITVWARQFEKELNPDEFGKIASALERVDETIDLLDVKL